ncbi:hypothetical protein [Streptomyces europaeiscabiei]|uniref:hypothetical protein n=1 Tax=Streptomyces europaeiscabiei TaxID=146819 RepID=UPI000A99089B|nr:hypothetical protein [Streptomyces europaeiscabiei]
MLLTATAETTERRLRGRETGSEVEREPAGGARKARPLEERAPPDTVRIATDGRTVVDISTEVPAVTGRGTGS